MRAILLGIPLVCVRDRDDETLGCGGTILKRRAASVEAFWLIETSAQVYSDVTETLNEKLEIMRLYGTEAQDDPLPHGATVEVESAEAFALVRELV